MALNLESLLEGIYGSILEARRYVNEQHLKLFQTYFDTKQIRDPETGETIKAFVPELVPIATDCDDDGNYKVMDVPVLSLIPMSTLSIDTLEIDFETRLTDMQVAGTGKEQEGEDLPNGVKSRQVHKKNGVISRLFTAPVPAKGKVKIMPKGKNMASSTSPARVKVTFKINEPAEGATLIQEQMLDYIRK